MKYTVENYKNAKSDDVFEFTCQTCGKMFTKTKREIQKNGRIIPKYCSQECSWKNKNLGTIEVVCAECGKVKTIKISEYNKSDTKNFFCNSSCAAKYNNRKYPKRQKTEESYCPICGKLKSKESELCKKCETKRRKDEFSNRKIGDFIGYETKNKYLTIKCTKIRKHARQVLIDNKIPCVCAICHNHEFDCITEVHHKKSITDFSPDTTIGEVNSVNNLVWLCPNHHRLVHLGILKI